MEAMDRKLPSTIDYSDVLPMSVPAVSRRRKFYPVNGGEFAAQALNEIRIPLDSQTALCDVDHSYLQFTVTNTNAAATLSLDAGGAAMFWSRVRIEQAGKVLSDTNEYNRLMASVLNPCVETRGGRIAASIRDSTQAGQTAVGNVAPFNVATRQGDRFTLSHHGSGQKIGAGASYTFVMPLITGLFTQDKLLPLPLVDKQNPITIVLTLEEEANLGLWQGAAPAVNSSLISQICYNAQLVEVGGDVINQFAMMRDMMGGQLAISGQDWEHSSAFLQGGAAGGAGERVVNVPMRKRSIKSLFWVANSSDLANTAGPLAGLYLLYNKSFSGGINLDSWQIKVGSVTYPPTAIQAPGRNIGAGAATSQLSRGEVLKELSKAIGTLSFASPTGALLNTMTYFADAASAVAATTATGDNGVGGVTLASSGNEPTYGAPMAISLDSFNHTAIEAGVDSETMALQTSLILNINSAAGNIGAEDKTIHTWICYDKHYYFNADGSVTMSD